MEKVIILSMIGISLVFGITMYNSASRTLSSDVVLDDMDQMEISTFNAQFTSYEGEMSGTRVRSLLDQIIRSNENSDYIIVVEFENNTYEQENISEISNSIRSAQTCNVSFEYDVNGRVSKAIINKLVIMQKNPAYS